MSHLPFTISAYLFNSISVTIDKFLLTKHIPDPLVYIFYFSAFSLLVLFLLPFTHLPALPVFALASFSTLLWTSGAYFMFKAIQNGQVSRVIPIIGTLIPLILLFEAVINHTINLNQIWAVIILVLGLIALTVPDWKGELTKKELFLELTASILFAASYLILREAYLHEQFLSVFVSSRLILIPVGALIFAIPHLRHRVLTKQGPKLNLFSKAGALFLAGQAAGGSSELLLTFSISLATPALVNSLQGVQYAFLFIFSLALSKKYPRIFKEDWSRVNVGSKIVGILLIGVGLFILSYPTSHPKPELGVTFSPRYAQQLGLNPHQIFSQMLTDLNVKNVRLPLYWDEVEPQANQFDFSSMQFYLDQAQKHHVNVILVVGEKVPRWPECFFPTWVNRNLGQIRQLDLLMLVDKEVNQFKNYPNLIAWQVENEPLLIYGKCPTPDSTFLQKEVNLVRSADPKHKILVTGSGELSSWWTETQISDYFGTTMYRTVWDRYLGYFNYPIPPIFYQLKYSLAKLFAPANQKALVAELQAEPWVPAEKQINQISLSEQKQNFPLEKLNENLNFAQQVGFSPVYFWGVEWWYYMQSHGDSSYVNEAKQIFNQ